MVYHSKEANAEEMATRPPIVYHSREDETADHEEYQPPRRRNQRRRKNRLRAAGAGKRRRRPQRPRGHVIDTGLTDNYDYEEAVIVDDDEVVDEEDYDEVINKTKYIWGINHSYTMYSKIHLS